MQLLLHRAALLVTIVAALGCASTSAFTPPSANEPGQQSTLAHLTHDVWIVRHRFHTGFAFAAEELPEPLAAVTSDFGAPRFVEIGWGDRAFYMASGDDYLLGARALLWPTDTVMHVVAFDQPVAERFPRSEIVKLTLDEASFDGLVAHVQKSFRGDEPLREGLYGKSLFYPAHGSFHLFRTCNVWTAEGLEAAGLPVASWRSITARSVLDQAAASGEVIRSEEMLELAH